MKHSAFILALVALFAFSSNQLSAQKLKNSGKEKISKEIEKTSGEELKNNGMEKISKEVEKTSDGMVDGEYFGEKFKISSPTAVENVIKRLESQDTIEVQIAGVVQKVCKSKGCWTNVGSTMESDQNVFVKFKDYGFFLPVDCDGKNIILEGKAYVEVTSVEELRHYAQDEGRSSEDIAAITKPAREVKYMATGAYLKN